MEGALPPPSLGRTIQGVPARSYHTFDRLAIRASRPPHPSWADGGRLCYSAESRKSPGAYTMYKPGPHGRGTTCGVGGAGTARYCRAQLGAATAHMRCIIHIDLDCFYVQVDMLRLGLPPERPVAVTQKFLVVTCNYAARAAGVTKLMATEAAQQRCPDLLLVSGEDLTPYREASEAVFGELCEVGPTQRLGMDEFFIDATAAAAARLEVEGAPSAWEERTHVHRAALGTTTAEALAGQVCTAPSETLHPSCLHSSAPLRIYTAAPLHCCTSADFQLSPDGPARHGRRAAVLAAAALAAASRDGDGDGDTRGGGEPAARRLPRRRRGAARGASAHRPDLLRRRRLLQALRQAHRRAAQAGQPDRTARGGGDGGRQPGMHSSLGCMGLHPGVHRMDIPRTQRRTCVLSASLCTTTICRSTRLAPNQPSARLHACRRARFWRRCPCARSLALAPRRRCGGNRLQPQFSQAATVGIQAATVSYPGCNRK